MVGIGKAPGRSLMAGESKEAEDRGEDEQSKLRSAVADGEAAEILDLALLRVVADAGLGSAPWQARQGLLAGERAVLGIRDFLGLDRDRAREFLAGGRVHHEEDHVGEVHRLDDVLEMVAARYVHIRVVVDGIRGSNVAI